MHVGIDQAGEHGLAFEIDLARGGTGQAGDLGAAAHGQDAAGANREGVGKPELRVGRDDLAVAEDQIRGLRAKGGCGKNKEGNKSTAVQDIMILRAERLAGGS